jgi:hypothetical protein
MRIIRYLIASEENDYNPWILSTQAAAVFTLAIWSLRLIIPASLVIAAPSIDATDLMNKVNFERSKRFIQTLNPNEKLNVAATGKSQDMLNRSYFAHVDPDGNYVWPRIEAAGYTPYLTLGENLAMDFTDAQSLVDAWMNSPTHRANIINEKFEDQGMASLYGLYEPRHNSILVTNLFGTLIKTVPATPSQPSTQTKPTTTKPKPVTQSTNTNTNTNTQPTTPTKPAKTASPAVETPTVPLNIEKDIKVTTTEISGQIKIDVRATITGSVALATARIKGQSITLLLDQASGLFLGTFTFDATENLSGEQLAVEARDKDGKKITQEIPINVGSPLQAVTNNQPTQIPVSSDAYFIKILRFVFAGFAIFYLIFLLIDAVIIYRNNLKRDKMHPNGHILVLFLVAIVNLFANKF